MIIKITAENQYEEERQMKRILLKPSGEKRWRVPKKTLDLMRLYRSAARQVKVQDEGSRWVL